MKHEGVILVKLERMAEDDVVVFFKALSVKLPGVPSEV
jgi:hypothetical protein